MTEYEKQEFWQALGRLYEATVKLSVASEALRQTAESHEKRLDHVEVVQQWLAEKERRREKEERGE